MRWRPKDPDASVDYSVDWSRYLEGKIINSVEWFIYDNDGTKTAVSVGDTVDSLTLANVSNTSTVATAKWSGGVRNKTYRVVCRIKYDNSDKTDERTIQLPIRDK